MAVLVWAYLGWFFEFETGPYSHKCVMYLTQTQIRKVEMTKTHHGRFQAIINPYGKQSKKRGKSSIFLPDHPHVKNQICIESEKIKKTKTSVFSKNPSEKTDVLGNTKFQPRRQIWFFTRKKSFFLSSRWTLQLSVFSLSA